MDYYKHRVFVVMDIEHVGNRVYGHPDPFAFGMAAVTYSSRNNAFLLPRRYRRRWTTPIVGTACDPNNLGWWQTQHPEMFARLSDPDTATHKDPGALAGAIEAYLVDVIEQNPTKRVVICADDDSDFTKVNAFMEKYGFQRLNAYTSTTGHGETLDLASWMRGHDLALDLYVSRSVVRSRHVRTEHTHTHDPLDDALELGERFAAVLNAHLAGTAQPAQPAQPRLPPAPPQQSSGSTRSSHTPSAAYPHKPPPNYDSW